MHFAETIEIGLVKSRGRLGNSALATLRGSMDHLLFGSYLVSESPTEICNELFTEGLAEIAYEVFPSCDLFIHLSLCSRSDLREPKRIVDNESCDGIDITSRAAS